MRPNLVALLAIMAMIGTSAAIVTGAVAGGNATMSVSPASQNRLTGQLFDVYVMVDTPNEIGAYEFSMVYDSTVLRVVAVTNDTFLGQTGRQPNCLNISNDNLIHFGCGTSGSALGPSGLGRLTWIRLEAIGVGTSPLSLRLASLADVNGDPLPVNDSDGSVTVLLGPTPTKTNTPQPTATAVPATPIPSSTPAPAATATATLAPAPTSTPAPAPTSTSAPATSTPVVAAGATLTPLPPTTTQTPKPPSQRTATAYVATQTRTTGSAPTSTSVPGALPASTGSSEPVTSAPQQGVLGAGRRPGIRLPDTGSGGKR